MDIREAIEVRHSVRQYKDIPIEGEKAEKLNELIRKCNEESSLNIQLILNDNECFNTLLSHYGKFRNANNYIALVGKSSIDGLDELAGYYGEKLVLEAQMMGLNTCWVAGTYGKGKCKADKSAGEKIVCVIAVGYGENEGSKHKSKPMEKLCAVREDDMPGWFKDGVHAAVLAPTALNQQKFIIDIDGEEAVITPKRGPLTELDLGIVRYNFEAASEHKCRHV